MTDTGRTAWAVVSGDYSDYRVHFITLDKVVAEEIVNRLGDGCEVEEFPLLSSADEYLEHISYCGWASVEPTGELGRSWNADWISYAPPGPARANAVPTGVLGRGGGQITVETSGRTPEAALHAAKEYATELASELAAGVPAKDAVRGFNERRTLRR